MLQLIHVNLTIYYSRYYALENIPKVITTIYETISFFIFQYPDVVAQLDQTLDLFRATEIPRGNKPIDSRADPKFWDYTWTNWFDYVGNNNQEHHQSGQDKYANPEQIFRPT